MLEGVVSRNRSNVSMDAYIDIDSRRSGHGYVHEKEIFNQLTVLSINFTVHISYGLTPVTSVRNS